MSTATIVFNLYRETKKVIDNPDVGWPTAGNAPVGDWRWHMKSSNGKIVAEGGEGYTHSTDMVRSIRKYVTRGDALAEQALERALTRARLDVKGRELKL